MTTLARKQLFAILALAGITLSTSSAAYKETLTSGAGGSTLDQSAREDLGNIREVNKEAFKPKFRARVTANGSYTTNSRLQGSHSSSDFLFQPTIEGGVNIPLGHGFDLDLVARIESVTYASRSAKNFFGASGAATLSYKYRNNVPRIYIGAEPYWYGQMDADRIASAIAVTAGTDHAIVFNRGHTVAFGGYQFYRYFAAPGLDNRDANQILVGLTHELKRNLFGQAFYSIRYENFRSRNHSDVRNVGGISLLYQVSENVFGTLTGTYIHNNSSDDIYSYSSAGLTLGVTWQF